jgi:hypothetical protein
MPQLESGEPAAEEGGWGPDARTTRAPSGIWLVVVLDKSVPEGEWKPSRAYRSSKVQHTWLGKADSGMEAIAAVYGSRVKFVGEGAEEEADARYVALDFYGGERVEAFVNGEWVVNVKVAPQAIGPTQ